jgi:ferric-dicitrate binding protein FerR (iron transport regulator)
MKSETTCRKLTALCLSMAVLCLYSTVTLATSGDREIAPVFAELSARGNVSLNGLEASSGTTVFPDSRVSTAEGARAIISFGKLCRTELSSNSNIKLGFTDSASSISLDGGRVRVSVPALYAASVLTKDGAVVSDSSQSAIFTVETTEGRTLISTQEGRVEFRAGNVIKAVAAGEELLIGAARPTAAASSRRRALWILFGISIAVAITAIALSVGDDEQPVVSPMT